jgi:hypothetical protein
MLGNNFLVVGRKYVVITHRPDTSHNFHYFEVGEVVTCIGVARNGVEYRGGNTFFDDIERNNLSGTFINSKGLDQSLYVGDVKLCPVR